MIPLVQACITPIDRAYMQERIADGLLEHETEVRRYEEAFAELVNCKHAIAVNSGTTALTLALHGRRPTIPTYTCVAVRNAANAVRYTDSRYDVKTATLTLLPKHPDTLVVPHTFGQPTSYAAGLAGIVEDYTLSLGNVSPLLGELGVCSTHWSKMISTGRGGIIFSNNTDLIDELRLRVHYETHTNRVGSYAMSSMQAALGISQLRQLSAFIERRREIAHLYSERFTQAGIDCPDPDSGSVFFRYLIADSDPAGAMSALHARGVEAGRGVHPLLHQLDGFSDDKYPGAVHDHNRLLSIPCHPSLTDKDVAFIADNVIEVCAP